MFKITFKKFTLSFVIFNPFKKGTHFELNFIIILIIIKNCIANIQTILKAGRILNKIK